MFRKCLFRIIILSVCLVYSDILSSQVGPNDFDVEDAMNIMDIRKGMVIGEAGAGRGFFTFPMAEKVGVNGKIYANDIRDSALGFIRNSCERRSISNITTVLGEVADPLFPVEDLLKNLRKYMRSGATLAILDRDPDRWGRMHYHFQTKDEVVGLLKDAGFKNIKVNTSLEYDNIYLAKKY